jgi:hypothetical protein
MRWLWDETTDSVRERGQCVSAVDTQLLDAPVAVSSQARVAFGVDGENFGLPTHPPTPPHGDQDGSSEATGAGASLGRQAAVFEQE